MTSRIRNTRQQLSSTQQKKFGTMYLILEPNFQWEDAFKEISSENKKEEWAALIKTLF